MKTDYPELAGKAVVFSDRAGTEGHCVVVDCNYHIGITLVDRDTKKERLCLNRKEVGEGCVVDTLDKYKKAFHAIIKGIQDGNVVGADVYDAFGHTTASPAFARMTACAWK